MSVKRALQIESDVVTSRSVVIPFEFKPETLVIVSLSPRSR